MKLGKLCGIVEGVTIGFTWWAFDWKVAVLVFLVLWCAKLDRRVKMGEG